MALTNPTSVAEVEFFASSPLKSQILSKMPSSNNVLSIKVMLFMSEWKPKVESAE